MPSPFLRATSGRRREFYCSLCNMKFRTEIPPPEKPALVRTDQGDVHGVAEGVGERHEDAKVTLQNEWDEHLRRVYPRQSEREQKKKARRRAAAERLNSKSKREQG